MINKTESKNSMPKAETLTGSKDKDNLAIVISLGVTAMIAYGWMETAVYRLDLLKASPKPGPYENNSLWNATTVPEDCKIETIENDLQGGPTIKNFLIRTLRTLFCSVFVYFRQKWSKKLKISCFQPKIEVL